MKDIPHKNLVDVTGQRFGRLVVKELLYRKQSRETVWLCLCDCGTEVSLGKGKFVSGNTKSCGCHKKEVDSERFRKPKGMASRNCVIGYYQCNARKAGREFTLTNLQLDDLFSDKCFYCGSPPSRVSHPKNCNGEFVYNGIDRLNPESGYTINNVVSCCTACNVAKQQFTLREFKDWLKCVYQHMNL